MHATSHAAITVLFQNVLIGIVSNVNDHTEQLVTLGILSQALYLDEVEAWMITGDTTYSFHLVPTGGRLGV